MGRTQAAAVLGWKEEVGERTEAAAEEVLMAGEERPSRGEEEVVVDKTYFDLVAL